ncbi:MAG: hypothetical protein QXH35_09460 [Nitrososphaerota archaeon]
MENYLTRTELLKPPANLPRSFPTISFSSSSSHIMNMYVRGVGFEPTNPYGTGA